MTTLAEVESGKEVIIKEILAGQGLRNKLLSMGLREGERVKVLINNRGPIVVLVGSCRLGLGRGMANKILVEELGE